MHTHWKLLAATLPLFFVGCTVGPDYKKPDVAVPDNWSAVTAQTARADIEQEWWHRFNDPVLDHLIEKVIADNFDLKIAEARIAEARAAQASTRSDLFPTGGIKGSATREANQFAIPGNIPGLTKPFNIFQIGFDSSWELDLFGGKKREVEASSAEVEAAAASRDDVRVSLMAEVARTYVDIRQYQAQLKITDETIKAEQSAVSIVGERYRSGQTSELDLTQAKAQLEQMKAQMPYYQNLLAQAEYSLDVLLGEPPGAAHAIVQVETPVPLSNKDIVLAAPADVIANRPDIRVAERQLASATAQQGAATAQLFPDISLSGFIGLLNTDAGHLVQSGSKSWSAGGNVMLPIFNYGKIYAGIDAADARQQEALATYQKSIIAALSDVAKTYTAYTKQEEFGEALTKTVSDNRETTSIAHLRYKDGLSSFIDVLDAQRTLYASESQLVTANAQISQDMIAVYKSLGGGWRPASK